LAKGFWRKSCSFNNGEIDTWNLESFSSTNLRIAQSANVKAYGANNAALFKHNSSLNFSAYFKTAFVPRAIFLVQFCQMLLQ
jgi:hypothetical protein